MTHQKQNFLLIIKYNIKGCKVVNKENGLVIKIETDKLFNEDVISTSITRGGWLNVNVRGGLLDSIGVLENSKINSSIIQIKPKQKKNLLQISFLLKEDFEDYGISSNKTRLKFH